MARHTSFKLGGPADCLIKLPCGDSFESAVGFTIDLINAANKEQIPVFVLGGGANILVSDKGIRGITLDTSAWTGETEILNTAKAQRSQTEITFLSGTSLDVAAEAAAAKGLSGLEFLAGMPGSIGGALWMNARAYEQDIAGVAIQADILDFSSTEVKRHTVPINKSEFGYKKSPFQNQQCLILSVLFSLQTRDTNEIRCQMEKHRLDRSTKGHYRYPSAGSAFKNNHDFGKPTGQIIDELGLKGLSIGGAQIAPFHGNIIINTGNATAENIRDLLELTAAQVKNATGFILEPEILLVGEW